MCVVCGERWAQSKLGLCRRCERSTGADLRTGRERDRDQVEARKAKRPALAAPTPAGPYELRLPTGEEFIVVWHGGMPGPGGGWPTRRPQNEE